jgi:hypothetical protein
MPAQRTARTPGPQPFLQILWKSAERVCGSKKDDAQPAGFSSTTKSWEITKAKKFN